MSVLRSYVLVFEAKEPISYGEESVGLKTIAKRISLYLPEDEKVVSIPAILGNAVRGVLRDVMSEVFIEEVLKHVEAPEWHAGALVALFSGGLLRTRERAERATSGRIAVRVAELLRYILPFSIMGCALPGLMVPSKVKVSVFYPVCEETKALIEDLMSEEQIQGNQEIREKLSKAVDRKVEDLMMEVQLMRKDDTIKIVQISQTRNIRLAGLEEVGIRPSRVESEEEVREAVQMLFYRQALAPGTLFIGRVCELMPLRGEELGLLSLSLKRLSAVGGAIARGFGHIVVHNLPDLEDEERMFGEFVEENAETISGLLGRSPDDWVRVSERR